MTTKQVLFEMLARLSDLGASVDALQAVLIRNGQVMNDDIDKIFAVHKQVVERDLATLRAAITLLPD
jgi:hypothetical protein